MIREVEKMNMNMTGARGSSILFYLPIINLVIVLFILGLGIYTTFLIIKALKIYIKKNS